MRKILMFLVSMFTAAGIFADPCTCSNFYIDGFGGFNFVNSHKQKNLRVDVNAGYAVGGALGYKFSNWFRLEIEGAYRSNTFEQMVIQGVNLPASGSIKKATAMANGIFEICLFDGMFLPFLGGGLGERWDRESFLLEPISLPEGTWVFDKIVTHSRGFAGQVIVGFVFSKSQKAQATVEYRYLDGPHLQANHTVDVGIKRYF